MTKQKRISIVILSLIGLLASIKLTVIYFNVNFNPYALPSFCSINNFIDCDSVAKTTFSQFLGIPLALWGLCLYLFILFLSFTDYLKNFKYLKFLEVFKNPSSYIFSIMIFSFAVSMLLACISIFKIEKICILCVLTYFLDFIIAIVAKSWGKGFLYDFKASLDDFIAAVKVKKYLISLIILIILAAIFLAYTSLSYVFTPQVKQFNSIESFRTLKSNPYKVKGNLLGDKAAKIVINEYIDYNCEACYINNIMLHRAVRELSNIRVVQHHLPLDMECNPYVTRNVHEHSCLLSRYAIASKYQDKFWEMNDLLFEKTPKSEQEVLALAATLKFDIVQLYEDANSEKVKKELKQEIEKSAVEGINGTPTLIININKTMGVLPYYELKEKLIKMGAVERK